MIDDLNEQETRNRFKVFIGHLRQNKEFMKKCKTLSIASSVILYLCCCSIFGLFITILMANFKVLLINNFLFTFFIMFFSISIGLPLICMYIFFSVFLLFILVIWVGSYVEDCIEAYKKINQPFEDIEITTQE